eukprot:3820847-Pyramimonas_sp.AAC.1
MTWKCHPPRVLLRHTWLSGGRKAFASDCGRSLSAVGYFFGNFRPYNGCFLEAVLAGGAPRVLASGEGAPDGP